LAEQLERELAHVDDKGEIAEITYRRAELLEQRLEQPDRAVDLYQEVLATLPEHAGALTALERLVQVPSHRARVSRLLETIYQNRKDARNLVYALRAQRRSAGDAGDLACRLEPTGRIPELSRG